MVKKFILALFLIFISGCAPPTMSQADRAMLFLQRTQVAAVGIADIADDLCTQGLLTQSECGQVKELYFETFAAWVRAEEAYKLWLSLPGDSAWENYLMLREKYIGVFTTFNTKAKTLGVLEFQP